MIFQYYQKQLDCRAGNGKFALIEYDGNAGTQRKRSGFLWAAEFIEVTPFDVKSCDSGNNSLETGV